MLDLNHPRATYVFHAANIQDKLRICLLQWEETGTPPANLNDTACKVINALHELNAQHFDDNKGITRTLESLRSVINAQDCAGSWSAFLALAEWPGDNFGTWAI